MCLVRFEGSRVSASRCPAYEPLARFYAAWGHALDSPEAWLAAPTAVLVVHCCLSGGVFPALTTRAITLLKNLGPELRGVGADRVACLPDVDVGLRGWASAASYRDLGGLPRDLDEGWDRDPVDLDRLSAARARRLAEAAAYAESRGAA